MKIKRTEFLDILNTIIEIASLKYEEKDTGKSIKKTRELISDEEIDALLTNDTNDISNDYFDVFDISEPMPDDLYTTPIRSARIYTFDEYEPVSLLKLQKNLDHAGERQLKTILIRTGLSNAEQIINFQRWNTAR